MLFAAGGTVFVSGGAVLVVDETVFAMDGAVSLQNRQPAACQSPPTLRFRCIWVKHLLQAALPCILERFICYAEGSAYGTQ